jgi:beta-barrel assembly-enhancing protease
MFRHHLQCQTGFTFTKTACLTSLASAVILLICLIPYRLAAQDYDHYQPLKCSNPIPEELRTASSTKYESEKAQLGVNHKDLEGKSQDEFLLQSNYVLDEMLLSGKVLFNDPVTEYVTRVKDLILISQPALQQKIRIYVVKSPIVNAFATNNGALLVNMGLLAHLHNEAELALVLCHEIQHYIKKHPINSYVTTQRIKKGYKMLGQETKEAYLAATTKYSRELEQEADDLGFELFRTTGYAMEDASKMFDVLAGAHLPFDQLPWNPSFFEFDYLRFPTAYTRAKLDTIRTNEDESDSLSTHPNIGKRRISLLEKIKAAGKDEGETFKVGIAPFLDMRKRCRFELCEMLLNHQAYELSLYNAYLLLAEEPESHYLQKTIALSLYGLAVHKNAHKFSDVHFSAKHAEGELQQLLHFTETCDREILTLLALRYCWKTYLSDPNDQDLKAVAEDMIVHLFRKHGETANWLEQDIPETIPALIDSVVNAQKLAVQAPIPLKEGESDTLEGSGENLKDPGKRDAHRPFKKEIVDDNEWAKWALCDLFSEKKFQEAWETLRLRLKDPNDEAYLSPFQRKQAVRYSKAKGAHLGIDKLVMLQPIYRKMNFMREIPIRYMASEAALNQYREMILTMADRNHVDTQFLENRNLQADQAETFNDVATMMAWMNEFFNAEEGVRMVNFKQDEVQEIIQKYGTQYFAYNGVLVVRDKLSSDERNKWLVAAIILYPLLPLIIANLLMPHNRTYYVNLVFDIQEGKMLLEEYRYFRGSDRPRRINSTLQDTFYQIKSRAKKE